MIIELVKTVIHCYCLAVAYYARKNTDYMLIGYTALKGYAVVTANYIIIFSNLYYAMKNILTARRLIQGAIVLFQPALGALDYHNVPMLAKKRHHTHTDIGVNYFTVLLKLLLVGRKITHLSLRYCEEHR